MKDFSSLKSFLSLHLGKKVEPPRTFFPAFNFSVEYFKLPVDSHKFS